MSSESPSEAARIDKVRASRAGHTYHATWTARVALERLVPTTTLTAIAVEAFSTEDAPIASAAATGIADLVRDRGGLGIALASQVEVMQFKYSGAQASVPVRATDLRQPLAKFAAADTGFAAEAGPLMARNGWRDQLDGTGKCLFRLYFPPAPEW